MWKTTSWECFFNCSIWVLHLPRCNGNALVESLEPHPWVWAVRTAWIVQQLQLFVKSSSTFLWSNLVCCGCTDQFKSHAWFSITSGNGGEESLQNKQQFAGFRWNNGVGLTKHSARPSSTSAGRLHSHDSASVKAPNAPWNQLGRCCCLDTSALQVECFPVVGFFLWGVWPIDGFQIRVKKLLMHSNGCSSLRSVQFDLGWNQRLTVPLTCFCPFCIWSASPRSITCWGAV